LPSENPSSTLALRGEVSIEYFVECVNNIKDELIKNAEMADHQPEQAGALAESLETYGMTIKIDDMFPFMCDARDLDGRSIRLVNKRRILEPLSLKLSTKDNMLYDRNSKTFKTFGNTLFEGKQMFITISYQDIINIANAFIYNMRMLEHEYFNRLIQFNKMKSRGIAFSEIEELKEETSGILLPTKINSPKSQPKDSLKIPSTSLNLDSDFLAGLKLEKSHSDYTYARSNSMPEENITTVLSNAMQAMEQLKKASKAMKMYKEKAAEYTRKSQKSLSSFGKSNDSKTNIRTYVENRKSNILVEENKTSLALPKMDDSGHSSNKLSFIDHENSGPNASIVTYERIYDNTRMVFESIKLVFF